MKNALKTITLSIGSFVGLLASAGSYNLKVTEKGFEPSSFSAPAGEDITLNVTRTTDSTCATKIQVPSKKISYDLPLNKPVTIKLGKLDKGDVEFGCGMNMMAGGVIIVK